MKKSFFCKCVAVIATKTWIDLNKTLHTDSWALNLSEVYYREKSLQLFQNGGHFKYLKNDMPSTAYYFKKPMS